VQPFLKWPGGKKQLLPRLLALLPKASQGRYIDLMIGGGALPFALPPDAFPAGVVLGDASAPLIATYAGLRLDPVGVHRAMQDLVLAYEGQVWLAEQEGQPDPFRAGEPLFMKARAGLSEQAAETLLRGGLSSPELAPWAGRFIFANRASFNGLWRINQKGACNSPFGKKLRLAVPDEAWLTACSRRLQDVHLVHGSVLETLQQVAPGPGDFVFLDPPYGPLEDGVDAAGAFQAYTSGRFPPNAQRALLDAAVQARDAGAQVVLVNGDYAGNREAYEAAGFVVETTAERRVISRDGAGRGVVACLLAVGTPESTEPVKLTDATVAPHSSTCIDLFSGACGASVGLGAAGYEHVLGVEWDEAAAAVASAAGFTTWRGDVRALTDWIPRAVSGLAGRPLDLLWASPPCQEWSMAGKRAGATGERNGWPWTWAAVDALRAAGVGPRAVLCENVRGILTHAAKALCGKGADPKPELCPRCYWDHVILPEARARFAVVDWRLLDAADFGVPQRRYRVILYAGDRPFTWPAPSHSQEALVWAKWSPAEEEKGNVIGGSYWMEHGLVDEGRFFNGQRTALGPRPGKGTDGSRPHGRMVPRESSVDAPADTITSTVPLVGPTLTGAVEPPPLGLPQAQLVRDRGAGLRKRYGDRRDHNEDEPAPGIGTGDGGGCGPRLTVKFGTVGGPARDEARVLKKLLDGTVQVPAGTVRWRTVRDALGLSAWAAETSFSAGGRKVVQSADVPSAQPVASGHAYGGLLAVLSSPVFLSSQMTPDPKHPDVPIDEPSLTLRGGGGNDAPHYWLRTEQVGAGARSCDEPAATLPAVGGNVYRHDGADPGQRTSDTRLRAGDEQATPQFRRLTPDECAALQSFPPGHPWKAAKTKTAQYKGIGNAVPPPLAEALGRALRAVEQTPEGA